MLMMNKMDHSHVEEEETASRKKDIEASWSRLHVRARHRRSKRCIFTTLILSCPVIFGIILNVSLACRGFNDFYPCYSRSANNFPFFFSYIEMGHFMIFTYFEYSFLRFELIIGM